MGNKETIDFFNQLINDRKEIVMNARQTGKSGSLMSWYNLHSKYERVQKRKETIQRLFNI